MDLLIRNLGREENTEDGKHVFGISRINDKGQVSLPAACRRVFGLNPGDSVLILGDEDRGIALVKIGLPAPEQEPADADGENPGKEG